MYLLLTRRILLVLPSHAVAPRGIALPDSVALLRSGALIRDQRFLLGINRPHCSCTTMSSSLRLSVAFGDMCASGVLQRSNRLAELAVFTLYCAQTSSNPRKMVPIALEHGYSIDRRTRNVGSAGEYQKGMRFRARSRGQWDWLAASLNSPLNVATSHAIFIPLLATFRSTRTGRSSI